MPAGAAPAIIALEHLPRSANAALAEEVDPAIDRRVLSAAGITPDPIRKPIADHDADRTGPRERVADPAWLTANATAAPTSSA